MAFWDRRKTRHEVTTVLDPSIAKRLDDATDRLEEVVQQLMKRLDEIERERAPKKAAKKVPAKTTKKAAAKRPSRKEAPGG